ncbi:MAG: hypothetical protein RLZZ336_563 [Cyanobacteriota bacterium]
MGQRILLIAEPLLAEGLTRLLEQSHQHYTVATKPESLSGAPQLVLWCVDGSIAADALWREAHRLHDSWQPAPLLISLPAAAPWTQAQLLTLPAEGLLQAPSAETLLAALGTVIAGGREVQLCGGPEPAATPGAGPTLGLGQWLLISGLQQIDQDLDLCERMLQARPIHPVMLLLLQGRRRELRAARALLHLLWGPLSLAWGPIPIPVAAAPQPRPALSDDSTVISLSQRNAEGTWTAICERLRQRIGSELSNRSGQLLALEGLQPQRRSDLLLALLEHLTLLRQQWRRDHQQPGQLREQWFALQDDLRRQALRHMASPYVQLPQEGSLRPVAETLMGRCDLSGSDPELPDPQAMLAALVLDQPLLVDGQLLPPDAPLALLHLEQLVANWLVRSAEQLSGQVLACCAAWPELRRYLLVPDLLSTRNLERLRNQLNAQQRWDNWLQRPIAVYESRRLLLTIDPGAITLKQHTEPRDQELRQLTWGQQLVTLALETRDALAPQLHSLIQGIGRVVVLLLTQVIGRAIGLVGRGIVQGMGRSLRASQ